MADDQTTIITISKVELQELIRSAIRAELHAVGLRADEPEQIDEAREDFRFLRRLRKATDSAAHKIGMTVLGALALGLLSAIGIGIKAMMVKTGGGQ